MTNEKNSSDKRRGTREASNVASSGGTASPLIAITRENFVERGKTFMAANGNQGFIIAKRDGKAQGVEYSQTLRQWGAWLAWRKHKGLPIAFMEGREFFTVPAEWPHLLDAEATVQGDHEAGWAFERYQRDEWAREKDKFGTAAQRLATTTAHRTRMKNERKPQATPTKHLAVAEEIDPPWRKGGSAELAELINAGQRD